MSQPTPTPTLTLSVPRSTAPSTAYRLTDGVRRLSHRAARPILLLGLAGIMIWFGAPKLFPGASPAEAIGVDTVTFLTGGVVNGDEARLALGLLEVSLGAALLIPRLRFWALLAVIGHMCATFTPLVIFPALTWHAPFVGSLEGQYIIKNILIIGAVLVLLGAPDDLKNRR